PVPILPGMLLSDEPGVYVAGSHGIRIENIILCEEIETNDDGTFLHFVPLTYVPIDPDGILVDEMEPSDLRRLNDYQAAVCDTLIPFMEGEDVTWLKRVTRELG
ncbi:MAG: M24 family metallopeptidase C-terminal domain-containing protein, partial [Lachnospiraceae bacterium]|nr:M24 family metallopeptidase C-terminal domain-containing protein [Lachnospiraceae bacterium]